MSSKSQWLVWLVATIGLVGYLAYSLTMRPASAARTFLPGVTTHGHYQIELQCQECHSPGMGVLQDACTRCHADELKRASDTHPRSKFTDPSKRHLLAKLDARSCMTCHQEHVPDRTQAMGLSLPSDYCWHCHQDIGEERPSHAGMAYDSCANAGCHNYHDNRALFEGFLIKHIDEPDQLKVQQVTLRDFAERWAKDHPDTPRALTAADQDAPPEVEIDDDTLNGWAATAHAEAGVNCSACHVGDSGEWFDNITHDACRECHTEQVEGFLASRHGMRLAVGLAPMTPGQARIPMNHDSFHDELKCVACHGSHEFDTEYAAAEACLKCHADEHSLAYVGSPHHALWQSELAGEAEPGTGVSCATCHLPRVDEGNGLAVQHNQNDYLRPNEKLARPVCTQCHGLQYSLDALADADLIKNNFAEPPSAHVESIDMAKAWSDERARLREERKKRRQAKEAKRTDDTVRAASKVPADFSF